MTERSSGELILEKTEPEGRVRTLTLNRPGERNPLDWSTLTALIDALRRAEEDGVRAVILTGAGSAFSAGGDLKGYLSLYQSRESFDGFLADFDRVCTLLEQGPFATFAMINGTCVAGGLEVALACDLVLAAESSRIGDGHLRFGQLPGAGGSQRLPRAIGGAQAKRWLLTGELYSARAALDAGLVAEVHPAEELPSRTLELAQRTAAHSPLAIRRMKELIGVAHEQPLSVGLARERAIVAEYATSSFDATEGLRAFAEDRTPRFRGG